MAYLASLIRVAASLQNTSSAGDTVKRLGAESDDQVKQIEQNVAAHKKAVSTPALVFDLIAIARALLDTRCCVLTRLHGILAAGSGDSDQVRDDGQVVKDGPAPLAVRFFSILQGRVAAARSVAGQARFCLSETQGCLLLRS